MRNTIRNILFVALAGCGKSFELTKNAKKALLEGKKFVYLSFNRNIRNEIIGKHNLSKRNVKTFHSLAYEDLFITGNSKKVFENIEPSELEEYFEGDVSNLNLNKEGLSKLISWWCENSNLSSFKNLDFIFVDELQDLTKEMIRMLKILKKMNPNVKIIAAGDPYQTIYNHLNEGKVNKNFEKFEKWFGETEEIELNKNYRSLPSILRFVNGFYKNQFTDNRFFQITGKVKNEDVFIHCIQHKREILEKVKKIIELYPDKQITILGRVHEELEPLEDIAIGRIKLSTIHAYKGRESEVIIIINTIFNDKVEKKEDQYVWNVSLTRAKEKLHIVSSFPKENLLSFFKNGTYILDNSQNSRKASKINDIPEGNIFLTAENATKSIIDSLEIQLKYENANCISRELQNIEKNSLFKTDTKLNIKGFDFVLHRHNKLLTFDCHNLNQLKNQGFNDNQILSFIEAVQNKYFNNNCSREDINNQSVKRLDLAMYFEVPSKKALEILALFFKLSQYKNSNEKVHLYEEDTKTAYLNSSSKKQKNAKVKRYRGIRAYFPYYKEKNKLNDGKNLLKVELYRVKQSNTDHRIGSLNITFGELKDINLLNLYYEWLYYEFPYLKEKPVKNIELIKKRLKVSDFNDARVLINNGKLSIKEKRNLFYVLLSLIDKDNRDLFLKIFKIKKEL